MDTVTATVTSVDVVKAGETLTFEIKLDRAPSFDGGCVGYSLMGPRDNSLIGACAGVAAGRDDVQVSTKIPETADDGVWYILVNWFWTGTKTVMLKSSRKPFRVLGKEGVVLPSSAEVAINPSQVQLLRKEILSLQTQVQSLKADLAAYKDQIEDAPARRILRRNILLALESLKRTESAFFSLAADGSQRDNARIFFDDLSLSYHDALVQIETNKKTQGFTGAVEQVSLARTPSSSQEARYPVVAVYAFRAFEQNELSYAKVADTQSLTFDLAVNSIPPEAAVSYRRRGDTFQPNPDPTNTVIKSLPFAIWIVQFQKKDYQVEIREHDPSRESNHVIYVELKKQQ